MLKSHWLHSDQATCHQQLANWLFLIFMNTFGVSLGVLSRPTWAT